MQMSLIPDLDHRPIWQRAGALLGTRSFVNIPLDDYVLNITASVDQYHYESFFDVLERKWCECSVAFIESVVTRGILTPICCEGFSDGFYQSNGHHRLAVAWYTRFTDIIPVSLDWGDYNPTAEAPSYDGGGSWQRPLGNPLFDCDLGAWNQEKDRWEYAYINYRS